MKYHQMENQNVFYKMSNYLIACYFNGCSVTQFIGWYNIQSIIIIIIIIIVICQEIVIKKILHNACKFKAQNDNQIPCRTKIKHDVTTAVYDFHMIDQNVIYCLPFFPIIMLHSVNKCSRTCTVVQMSNKTLTFIYQNLFSQKSASEFF